MKTTQAKLSQIVSIRADRGSASLPLFLKGMIISDPTQTSLVFCVYLYLPAACSGPIQTNSGVVMKRKSSSIHFKLLVCLGCIGKLRRSRLLETGDLRSLCGGQSADWAIRSSTEKRVNTKVFICIWKWALTPAPPHKPAVIVAMPDFGLNPLQ